MPVLVLAPMEGVTDAAFRATMTAQANAHSGIAWCVSEFVRVTGEPVPARVLLRSVPELHAGGRTPAGVPVHVQLLGGAAEPIARTAALAVALGAQGIDLNFGCPARKVNEHDGGAALLRSPSRIESIVGAVRAAVCTSVPVSAKLRLGWDSCAHLHELVVAAEAGGASWLTVHARTRAQGYRPPVDWEAIGRARLAVSIPVIANGDLRTVADIMHCGQQSGCRAFMIGRGALARPNLFRLISGWDSSDLDIGDLLSFVHAHGDRQLACDADERHVVCSTKQWLRFASEARPDERLSSAFDGMKRAQTWSEVSSALMLYWRGNALSQPHVAMRADVGLRELVG